MAQEPETDPDKEDLKREVKELNARIAELEDVLEDLREPLRQMNSAAKGYFRFVELYMKFGAVSPDKVIPGVKDPISREIINILFEKNGQNISQITDGLRERRGSASRRIVRERLAQLVEKGYVERKKTKRSVEFYVTDELKKKWSQVLGLDK